MIEVTTLDNKDIIRTGRRLGNSTRQAFWAIDKMFEGNTVKILDHFDNGNSSSANRYLLIRIIDMFEKIFPNYVKLEKVGSDKLRLKINPDNGTIYH